MAPAASNAPSPTPYPPLHHFLARLNEARIWGEVRVLRLPNGFELRHRADLTAEVGALRAVRVEDLRRLADTTADGCFRPLKSAPTLVRGWVCRAAGPAELGEALQALYPGSLADAWAWETGQARGADFAEVAARQPGRGGALRGLTGAALAAVVEAGCAAAVCLDRRCWSAAGVAPDSGEGKGEVPCLEPCAVFLAFAQACARTEHAATVPLHFAPDDLATLAAALRHVLAHPAEGVQEGELEHPLHPRRVARVLARYPEVRECRSGALSDADTHE